jgi:hypothetical protein
MHFWHDLWPELVVLLALIAMAGGLFLTLQFAH